MFDFEKLEVYQVIRELNSSVYNFLNQQTELDPYLKDQLKRASLSALLNLSESTGRMTVNDKKHFITISRGSVNECVSLLQVAKDLGYINDEEYNGFYGRYEQASKMLLGMYRSYSNKQ
jgi:four helix bundle protein